MMMIRWRSSDKNTNKERGATVFESPWAFKKINFLKNKKMKDFQEQETQTAMQTINLKKLIFF